jgi:uncharacterized protein
MGNGAAHSILARGVSLQQRPYTFAQTNLSFTFRLRHGGGPYIPGRPVPNPFSGCLSTDKLRCFMAISEELLAILVCPVCKAKVVLNEDRSGLKCVKCNRVYPVRDDIPVMLIDQATVEP